MFKFIGALVVYGFATYGLSIFLEGIQGRDTGKSGEAPAGASDRRFNIVR